MVFKQVETLPFPEGATVKAIGKVSLTAEEDSKYNIPHLHFLIIEGFTPNTLDAINLEYGLHGQGNDIEMALYDAVAQVVNFLKINDISSKEKFQQLIEEQDNHTTSDYWREFRKTEMLLALEQRDLGSAMVQSIRDEAERKLLELMDEKKSLAEELEQLKNFLQNTQKAELQIVPKKKKAA